MKKHPFLLALTLVCASATAVLAADPVVERVHGFKANKHSVEEIKDALKAGDTAAIVAPANALADFAVRIPGLFPPGSDQGKTDAKAEIWSNFPDFETKAKTFETRSRALADLAAGKNGTADKAQLGAAFGAVLDSCKACHRAYKED